MLEALKDYPVVQCFRETVLNNLNGGDATDGITASSAKQVLKEEAEEKAVKEEKKEREEFSSEYVYR